MKQTIRSLSLATVAIATIAAASSASAANASVVRATQVQLATLGYYGGPIDGAMGRQTADALVHFQSLNNLAVTGTITRETSQMLGQSQAYYPSYNYNYYYRPVAPVAYNNGYYNGYYYPTYQPVVQTYQPAAYNGYNGYYRSTYQPVAYSGTVATPVVAPVAVSAPAVSHWGWQ